MFIVSWVNPLSYLTTLLAAYENNSHKWSAPFCECLLTLTLLAT